MRRASADRTGDWSRAMGGVHRIAGRSRSDAVRRSWAGTRAERAVEADSGQGRGGGDECGGFGFAREDAGGDCSAVVSARSVERKCAVKRMNSGWMTVVSCDMVVRLSVKWTDAKNEAQMDMPDEYLTEIGRIIVCWNSLEYMLDAALIVALSGKNQDPDGRASAIFAHMAIDKKSTPLNPCCG